MANSDVGGRKFSKGELLLGGGGVLLVVVAALTIYHTVKGSDGTPPPSKADPYRYQCAKCGNEFDLPAASAMDMRPGPRDCPKCGAKGSCSQMMHCPKCGKWYPSNQAGGRNICPDCKTDYMEFYSKK